MLIVFCREAGSLVVLSHRFYCQVTLFALHLAKSLAARVLAAISNDLAS